MEESNLSNPFGVEPSLENASEKIEQKTEENVQTVESGITTMQGDSGKVAEVEYAGFWVRFAAVFVDGLILLIPTAIVRGIFGNNLGTFLGYVLGWTYAVYMLNTRQATWGKMAVGIKVATVEGTNPTVGKLMVREILGKILNVITLFIGYIMVAFTQKKQGLHDMIADTIVVYDPARKRRTWLVWTCAVFFVVIPILLGVILTSLNSARQKARDAQLKAQQKANELQVQIDSQQ